MKKIVPLFLALLAPFSFRAQEDSSSVEMDSASYAIAMQQVDSIIKSLDYKTGTVTINGDLATVVVPPGFKYLESKGARYLLEDVWGNPEDTDVLGLLVPDDVNMLAADSWAIIYTYEEDGHVDDDDAEDYDYNELLTEMQKQTAEGSIEREKAGYQPIQLVGWAKQPFYDKASHKLHWAKELKFGDDSINTLNYNIRMLGRKGVLVMNIVSGMDNTKKVETKIDAILASTNFVAGNKYEDFDSSTDKLAEYGIGGLIAGGILAKTGLLAKLGILLLKGWKIIALAIGGGFVALKNKIFKKKTDDHSGNLPQ